LTNTRQKLSERILEAIRDGTIIEKGKLLPERDLSRHFDVSRNLLREALVMLECMDVIEVRGREGVFVKEQPGAGASSNLSSVVLWPENMLRDLLEVRGIIEVSAAGLASSRRTEEDLRKIRQCLLHLEEIYQKGEAESGEGARWDALLHLAVVEAAHNRLLTRIFEDFAQVQEKYIGHSRAMVFSGGNWPRIILDQHRILFEAIRDQDRERAETAAREHIELARKHFAG
jgi:GntR family transcriptional repressor for pyruvate dehydrogenase complex